MSIVARFSLARSRSVAGCRLGSVSRLASVPLPLPSLNYTDADFTEVAERFVRAAGKMKADGFWWHDGVLTNKAIKRQILKEMLAKRFGR